jgi:TolB-like protein
MLISELSSAEAFAVVERERIEEILAELKLNQTSKIDQASANEAGRLLGARFFVVGGYFDMGGVLRVDARLVEVETGRIVKAVGVKGKSDDFMDIEDRLAAALATALVEGIIGTPAAGKIQRQPDKPVLPRPMPTKLPSAAVARYGRALHAKDQGNLASAQKELASLVNDEPSFALAVRDLAALAK